MHIDNGVGPKQGLQKPSDLPVMNPNDPPMVPAQKLAELKEAAALNRKHAADNVWRTIETLQGLVAAEIRGMLGEGAVESKNFTPEDRERRVAALKLCAAEKTTEEARHLAWMKMHEDLGWVYGETFDSSAKKHPNMVPWSELPDVVKQKARIFSFFAGAGQHLVENLP